MGKINGQTIKKLKLRRTYSIKEISIILEVHPHTVRRWQEAGLKPISPDVIPRLFFGKAVRDFLNNRWSKYKAKLLPDEFYCLRCRAVTKSVPNDLRIEHTENRIGLSDKQAIIYGICAVCGSALRRYSTVKKANESFGEGTTFRQGDDSLR